MVLVIKRSLRKILSKSKLTNEELPTVICKIESVVNSRPLCYIYDDGNEEIITPSYLFLGRLVLTKINNDFNNNVPNVIKFRICDKLFVQFLRHYKIHLL